MEWSCVKGSSDQTLGKDPSLREWSLEQNLQGGDHNSLSEFKGESGWHFQLSDLVLGSRVRNKELDLIILMGFFQLEIFYKKGFTLNLSHRVRNVFLKSSSASSFSKNYAFSSLSSIYKSQYFLVKNILVLHLCQIHQKQ